MAPRNATEINALREALRAEIRGEVEALTRRQGELAAAPEWDREPGAEQRLYFDRKQLPERAKVAMRDAVRSSRAVVESARESHRAAIRRADRKVDTRRAADLADDLRSRIALARPSGMGGGDARLDVLKAAMGEAIESLDPALLRSVRVVGSEIVGDPSTADPSLQRDLTRRLAAIAEDERAEIAAAEREVRDAEQAASDLRAEVLASTALITGGAATFGGAPTGLAAEILEERLDYTGEIVAAPAPA